jgi:hypothetical protein
MFTLVPPANIVWASDSPYGLPLFRRGPGVPLRAAGRSRPEQIHGIAGAQLQGILAGAEPLDLGPPPGGARALDRCSSGS